MSAQIQDVLIRDINESDGEGLSIITKIVNEENEFNQYYPIGMLKTPEILADFLYSANYRFGKTALVNNEVAGALWVRCGWKDTTSAVASIIIHPKYRGTGVAEQLVEAIKAEFPENRIIEVKVMEDNPASIKFCKKIGLEYLGHHIFDKDHPAKGLAVHDFVIKGTRQLTLPPTVGELDVIDLTAEYANDLSRMSNQVRAEAFWGEFVTIGKFTTPEKFVEYFNSDKYVFGKVGVIRGKAVGASWINLWDQWEASVLVDNQWRRAGVAAKIVNRLRTEIPEDKPVQIWIMEANQPSIKLCERLKFDKLRRELITDYKPLNGHYCWEFKMFGLKKQEK